MPPLAILLPHGTRGHRPNLAERGRGTAPALAPRRSPVPPRHRPPGPRARNPRPGHAVLRCAHPGQESARSPAKSGGGRPRSPSRSFRPRSPPPRSRCRCRTPPLPGPPPPWLRTPILPQSATECRAEPSRPAAKRASVTSGLPWQRVRREGRENRWGARESPEGPGHGLHRPGLGRGPRRLRDNSGRPGAPSVRRAGGAGGATAG